MNQNQKFKVKQFEWFEMETRVRQMVQQILNPIQKRIMQHSTNITKIKQIQVVDTQRVTELTMMVTNDPNIFQIGIFKEVDKRFQLHQKSFEEVKRLIQESNTYVEQKFGLLDVRMKETSDLLINFASLKQRVNKEVEMQNQNIHKVRSNLQKMIHKLSEELSKTNEKIVDNLMACQKIDKSLEERIRVNELDISINKESIENNKKNIHDKNIQMQTHELKMEKIFERVSDLQKGLAINQKIQQYIKDMEISIRKCEFRVEAITPLVTMAQLQEALEYILPEKLRKKIIIFGYKKYNKLNKEILDKNYNEVKEKFNGIDLIEAMQKKNMREITSLKRKKIISMGIDIDHLTFQARQRYYQELDMDELSQEEQDNQNNAKIDEAEILNLVSLYFNEFTTDVSEKVKTELSDTKAYLYGMESELKKQMEMNCQKIKKSQQHCLQFHRDQMLEMKSLQNKLQDVQHGKRQVQQWLNRGQEVERKFYNFCSLINHLQIQEEIDKQNISLMGLQENKSPLEKGNPIGQIQKNSVVEINDKCFSCCGYPASVLSSFKMACLAYHPSNIVIDGKDYRRQDVLEFTTNLLHTIKGNLQFNVPNPESPILKEKEEPSTLNHAQSHEFRTIHHRRHNEIASFDTLQKLGNSRLQYLSNEKSRFEQTTTINELNSKLTIMKGTMEQSPESQVRLKSTSMRLRKSVRRTPLILDERNKNAHKKTQSNDLSKQMVVVTNNFTDLKRRNLSYLT